MRDARTQYDPIPYADLLLAVTVFFRYIGKKEPAAELPRSWVNTTTRPSSKLLTQKRRTQRSQQLIEQRREQLRWNLLCVVRYLVGCAKTAKGKARLLFKVTK